MKRSWIVGMMASALVLVCAESSRGMYHPTLGRWLQRDPVGYADGMSVYQYARSRPMCHVDPRGLESMVFGNGVVIENGTAFIDSSTGSPPRGDYRQQETQVDRYNESGAHGPQYDVEKLAKACSQTCPKIAKCCPCTEEICREEARQIVDKYVARVYRERQTNNLGFWTTGLPGNAVANLGVRSGSHTCIEWQHMVFESVRRKASGVAWKCWRAIKLYDYYWIWRMMGRKDGHGFVGLYHCCNNEKTSPDAILDPWRDGLPYVFAKGQHGNEIDEAPNWRRTDR